MSLKQQILTDYVKAMKDKNEPKKLALSLLKTEITKAEKINNTELSDDAILKLIVKAISQRKDSIEGFTKGNRLDLVEKEVAELKILEEYLPSQLTLDKIGEIVATFISKSDLKSLTEEAKIGRIIGFFNKNYSGQFDKKELNNYLQEIVSVLNQ